MSSENSLAVRELGNLRNGSIKVINIIETPGGVAKVCLLCEEVLSRQSGFRNGAPKIQNDSRAHIKTAQHRANVQSLWCGGCQVTRINLVNANRVPNALPVPVVRNPTAPAVKTEGKWYCTTCLSRRCDQELIGEQGGGSSEGDGPPKHDGISMIRLEHYSMPSVLESMLREWEGTAEALTDLAAVKECTSQSDVFTVSLDGETVGEYSQKRDALAQYRRLCAAYGRVLSVHTQGGTRDDPFGEKTYFEKHFVSWHTRESYTGVIFRVWMEDCVASYYTNSAQRAIQEMRAAMRRYNGPRVIMHGESEVAGSVFFDSGKEKKFTITRIDGQNFTQDEIGLLGGANSKGDGPGWLAPAALLAQSLILTVAMLAVRNFWKRDRSAHAASVLRKLKVSSGYCSECNGYELAFGNVGAACAHGHLFTMHAWGGNLASNGPGPLISVTFNTYKMDGFSVDEGLSSIGLDLSSMRESFLGGFFVFEELDDVVQDFDFLDESEDVNK
jgi:hypothetical protein